MSKFDVRLLGIKTEAVFEVGMPEKAVRALKMLHDYGAAALVTAVSRHLSPSEAEKHREGIGELVSVGAACHTALERLDGAREVLAGRKFAVSSMQAPSAKND